VTIDVLPDGQRRPGGTALYSALQAARLGLEATIVTRGRETELQELLAPFSGELRLIVEPAPATTTLQTTGSGEQRRQRMLAASESGLRRGRVQRHPPPGARRRGVDGAARR
jgi:hypothetical protein